MTLGNNVVDKKAIRRFQTLESDFNKIHKFKFDYSNTIYINSKTKIKVHCEQHGDFGYYLVHI